MGTIWGMTCTQLYQAKLLCWYMMSFWLRLVNNVYIIWFFSLMTVNGWQFCWLLHLEEPKTKSFQGGLYCGWQWRKLNFDIFDRDSSSWFDTSCKVMLCSKICLALDVVGRCVQKIDIFMFFALFATACPWIFRFPAKAPIDHSYSNQLILPTISQ